MMTDAESPYQLGDFCWQVPHGVPDDVKKDQPSDAPPQIDHAATTTNGTAHQLASPQTSSQARPAPAAMTHLPPPHPNRPPLLSRDADWPPLLQPSDADWLPPSPPHSTPVQPSTSDGDITDVYSHPAALAYAASHPGRKIPLIGPYLLLQTLDEDEFSKVKLGLHSKSRKEVAVKLIQRSTVDHTATSRVEREIGVLRVRRTETLSTGFEIANVLLVSS